MSNLVKWVKQRMVSAVVALMLVVVVLWMLEEQQPVAMDEKPQASALSVTVIEPVPSDAEIKVSASGITHARWPMQIVSSVNGRVQQVAKNVIPGSFVKKGETIATLQDEFYQSQVEAARAQIAEAKLNLAEMQNRQYVAKTSHSAKSEFGRFEPHVKAAEANLEAAKAALVSAQQQLADTRIKAPFDAVVIAEMVRPGEWVNTGDVLLQVAASEFLDIKVELSEQDWQRVNGIQQGKDAIKIIASNDRQWPASLRYLSPVMDPVTRQRSMMLEVVKPFQSDTPLLADQQVRVVFNGAMQSHVVKAPASVLTDDGKVWSVIDESLSLETIELLDEQPDYVLFRYRDRPRQKRLLVRFPLTSFLQGQLVAASF